ncbi:MAG: hypothetical protein QNJ60_18260 [Xenococcaceae cyanobacterium MO_188.B19]|nr:hypothetical protein [Xenococcaceae cyanobacterium MO_188.B19]
MSKVISNLKSSQQEIIQFFHLESLAGSLDSLVSEIVTWAGNNLWLTKYICQAIVDYRCFIPSGMEAVLVEKIVQERVIEDWQNQEIAVHFNQIQEYFFTQSESYSRSLLLTYLDILQQGKVLLNNSRETERLIELGLVTEQENYFQISNRLYQFIFNYDWVQQQLFAIKLINKTPSHQVQTKASKNTFTALHNNPFSKIVAFMSLSGLGLIVSLIFFSIFETQFAPDIEIEQSRFEEQFLFPDEN